MRERAQQLLAWGRRHQTVVDAALAAGLAVAVLPGVLGPQDQGAGELLIAVAMMLPLAWRRRVPFAVFAAIALLALVKLFVTGPSLADVAVLFALYSVAVHERRGWAFPAAIAAVELGALAATVEYAHTGRVMAFITLSAFVVAAAALGFYVRTRHQHIAALTERARQAERERDQHARLAAATERARIAREMHDIVAHSLSVMIALADGARLTVGQDPDRAERTMRAVASTGREALDETRRLLGVLRDGEADAPLAPQPGMDALDQLVEQVRGAGIAARLTRTGAAAPMSSGTQLAVYRLVQEALTNTLKHARGASCAHVHLHYGEDALSLEVVDDGAPAAAPAGDGHGLSGMRERAAAYGGALEAGPRRRGGWRVRAQIPLNGERAGR